jgi:hypothetical protein
MPEPIAAFPDAAPKPPRPPRGLGTAGRRLWESVVADFELTLAEEVALEGAARTLDELRRLEAELKDAPVVTVGSKDQERPNGLFNEVRQHRATLQKLLGVLSLDSEQVDGQARSSVGRALARKRWGVRGGAPS